MNIPFNINQASVLLRDFRGESSICIATFSGEEGLQWSSKKVSSKKTSELPDLFDEVNLITSARSESALKFIRDFEITKRRTSIAADYNGFQQASLIAESVLHNGAEIDNTQQLSMHLKRALNAIESGVCGELVRLKFMYLFARNEGYAVREDFVRGLEQPQKTAFATLISSPSAELKGTGALARNFLDKLCAWIYANTDIIP